MHDIRHLIRIIEGAAQPEYFFHISAAANLQSIASRGLISGGDGFGNYSGEWESLPGVYLTDDVELISHMHSLRDDLSEFVIVVVAVEDMRPLLADEDIINIVCQKAWRQLGEPEYPFDDDESAREDVGAISMALARAANTRRSGLTDRVALNWWLVFEGGEESAEENWFELKEEFIRQYPRIKRVQDKRPHSVRYPGNIGFTGDPHIVAVLAETEEEILSPVVGSVPPSAQIARVCSALGCGLSQSPHPNKTSADTHTEPS